MTDHRPICPIPPDAKVGDVVVLRDGRRKAITDNSNDCDVTIEGLEPGWMTRDGSNGGYSDRDFECVAFEYADGRKPNLTHTKKPKRTQAQRDAAYIRDHMDKWWVRSMTQREYDRMLAIADRMEKQQ